MRHRKSENIDIFSCSIYYINTFRRKLYMGWLYIKKPLLLGVVNGEYRLRNITELIILISGAGFGHVLSPSDVYIHKYMHTFIW